MQKGFKYPSLFCNIFLGHNNRSYLKIRVLAQGQGRSECQPAGILKSVEDLKRGANTEIGLKNIFEMTSTLNI